MLHSLRIRLAVTVALIFVFANICAADTMAPRVFIARDGKGYLEKVGPQMVLHLKGTGQEMGHQQGTLLKDEIRSNFSTLETKIRSQVGDIAALGALGFGLIWQQQKQYMPKRYIDEMMALAKATGLEYDRVTRGNSIPEMFHCSGFAVFGKATTDGNLYHGRILDYGVGEGLQDHSVVVIAEPAGYNAFVNVTYAGFLGSVTGMNLKGIAFGEMGGDGQGKWDGMPMSFLMRKGMEEANTLKDAKDIFSNTKRTCEYYYVLSDANTNEAVGVSATPEEIKFVNPNEASDSLPKPIKDAVVLSRGSRYELLTDRVQQNWGKLDAAACRELMKRPVAMASCLHTALMSAKTKEIWIAHATKDGQPASEQPYVYLNVGELMAKRPAGFK